MSPPGGRVTAPGARSSARTGRRRRRLPPETDIIAYLLALPPELRARAIDMFGPGERDALDRDWPAWAHDGQRAPAGDWRAWVLMGGRGFGKTLAGANWIADAVMHARNLRIALVAATLDEARRIMVEGQSGLLRVAAPHIREWSPSRRLLRFAGGTEATLFSGASPEQLRGPEHHLAWCDELAKWEKPGETWTMLQLGLRLGPRPRALVTTTPRPGPVLRGIMAEPGCVVTRGATHANPHLPRAFRDTVEALYAGTRLGRQELDGELLAEGGALWTVEMLEACRTPNPPRACSGRGTAEGGGGARSTAECEAIPDPAAIAVAPPSALRAATSPSKLGEDLPFTRTVIGVDPPSGDGTCGIVACAIDAHGIGHVLADHSVTGRSPEGWARAVADAAMIHRAERVVAERNQGGKMVAAVLRAADRALRVKLVHASEGKAARAEPVALLFEAGKVRLAGRFPQLEAELLGLVAGGAYHGPGDSPDRADAMVWALTELMLGVRAEPGVRRV